MLGEIYLRTIKNIYESVSAVCSEQEVINPPLYPHSSPFLSLRSTLNCLAPLPPPSSHFFPQQPASAVSGSEDVATNFKFITRDWISGEWEKGVLMLCCFLNTQVECISKIMSFLKQFREKNWKQNTPRVGRKTKRVNDAVVFKTPLHRPFSVFIRSFVQLKNSYI